MPTLLDVFSKIKGISLDYLFNSIVSGYRNFEFYIFKLGFLIAMYEFQTLTLRKEIFAA